MGFRLNLSEKCAAEKAAEKFVLHINNTRTIFVEC
jgi:hypothetical protein